MWMVRTSRPYSCSALARVLCRGAEQRPGVRIPGAPRRGGPEPVELQAADVADARGELQSGELKDRERGEGLYVDKSR